MLRPRPVAAAVIAAGVVLGVGLTGPALARPDDATGEGPAKPAASRSASAGKAKTDRAKPGEGKTDEGGAKTDKGRTDKGRTDRGVKATKSDPAAGKRAGKDKGVDRARPSGSASSSKGAVKGWAKVMTRPAQKDDDRAGAKATASASPTPSAPVAASNRVSVESTPDPDNSSSAPPSLPVITGITEGDKKLTVTWTAPSSGTVDSYTVWVGGDVPDPDCDEIPAATHTCVVDLGLVNEKAYAVEVAANHAGHESSISQPWWASPHTTQVTVPSAPTLADIAVSGNKLNLSWTAPANDGGLAIVGYKIMAMRTSDSHAVPCVQSEGRRSTQCTIMGMAGVEYKAKVTAWNTEGDSPASAEKTATAQSSAPGAPTVTAALNGNTVTVTAASSDNGGVSVDGYEIAVTRTGSQDAIACAGTQANGLYTNGSCTFDGVQGESYQVKARAKNSVGFSPLTTVTRNMAPAAPTAAIAVDGRAVTVSWTPHGTGGAPIQGYLVSVHREGQQEAVPCAGQMGQGDWASLYTGDHCTLTGVPGAEYSVTVKARNSVGTSDIAGTDSETVPALAGPAEVKAAPGDAEATVTWKAITPATGITGYTVTYTKEGGVAQMAQVQGADKTSHELTGLENKATYSIKVKAVLSEGTATDSAAVLVTPSAPATVPPSAPEPDGPMSAPADAKTPEPGESITVSGTGYAPNSRIDLVIYSSPQNLGSTMTDQSGAFSRAVTIPSGLSGSHTITSFGVDSNGNSRVLALGVTIAATGTSGSSGSGGLAVTGAPIVTILLTGILLVASGAASQFAGRRRRVGVHRA